MAWGVVVTPIAVQAADCYTPAETSAVEVRMLQSELMVAALACRDSNPELGMIAGYNDFVRRLSPTLVRQSKILQAHFKKIYGAAGIHRFEDFETSLANAASKHSMTSAGYCQNAAVLFRDVTTVQSRNLVQFSAERATEIGLPVTACKRSASAGLRLSAEETDR
jgi:hypothetical protein